MKDRNRSQLDTARLEEPVLQVSKLLFEQDPMNTCCVENDAYDEYDAIAQLLVDQLTASDNPSTALRTALMLWFGEESVKKMNLASIEQQLDAQMTSTST